MRPEAKELRIGKNIESMLLMVGRAIFFRISLMFIQSSFLQACFEVSSLVLRYDYGARASGAIIIPTELL